MLHCSKVSCLCEALKGEFSVERMSEAQRPIPVAYQSTTAMADYSLTDYINHNQVSCSCKYDIEGC